MSIKSTISLAIALVALGFGSAAALAGEIPATGFTNSDVGTAYNQLELNYDAQGGLHVADPASAAGAQSMRLHARQQERALDAYASSDVDGFARFDAADPLTDPALTGGGSAGYNVTQEQSVYDR